jgi:cell division topological specificity factor
MFNGFLKKLRGDKQTKEVAKKRLKLTLVYDRVEVTDDLLQNLHRDIVEVISRYFEIDKNALKLDIRRTEDLSALVVNTPIKSTRHKSQPM